MIRQYLSNKNKSATVSKKKKSELNNAFKLNIVARVCKAASIEASSMKIGGLIHEHEHYIHST